MYYVLVTGAQDVMSLLTLLLLPLLTEYHCYDYGYACCYDDDFCYERQ